MSDKITLTAEQLARDYVSRLSYDDLAADVARLRASVVVVRENDAFHLVKDSKRYVANDRLARAVRRAERGKVKGDKMREEVDSRIIGGFDFVYRFFTRAGRPLTAFRLFSDDKEAIDWFKENFPDDYKAGAEMRRYYEEIK